MWWQKPIEIHIYEFDFVLIGKWSVDRRGVVK